MKTFILILFCFGLVSSHNAQDTPTKNSIVGYFGFANQYLKTQNDTINYYLFKSDKTIESKNLILFIPGSHPSPQFSYDLKNGKTVYYNWTKTDYLNIPNDFIYVIIEKKGLEKPFQENQKAPIVYHENNSLDKRVDFNSEVINHLITLYDFEKIIIYGHSEGAPVAAKLAKCNKNITHLGFWAGNALPDFFDTILEIRKSFIKNEISIQESDEAINEVLDYFSDVVTKNPLGTDIDDFGYTNKRWFSYAEPPINHLLDLDIPVFVQVASLDKSAPIESTYLIPLEFARLGKNNLTFKVCKGCDHGFKRQDNNGNVKREWSTIFKEFLVWANETE